MKSVWYIAILIFIAPAILFEIWGASQINYPSANPIIDYPLGFLFFLLLGLIFPPVILYYVVAYVLLYYMYKRWQRLPRQGV